MKAKTSALSRRSFLTRAGIAGAALGAAAPRIAAQGLEALPPLPWPYPASGLDADLVSKRAYCLYYLEGGCGQGGGQSIIDSIAEKLPYPWGALPRGFYVYGAGGAVGWGTICGALNGVLGAMTLLGVHAKLGNSLMDYFCTALLPTRFLEGWIPGVAGVPNPLPNTVQTISNSPLCHTSVSMWAAVAGVPVADASKKDRCAKLVGDVVAFAVGLLNNYFTLNLTPPAWTPPESYAGCYNCHTQTTMVPSQQGKMDCNQCHIVSQTHGAWKRRHR